MRFRLLDKGNEELGIKPRMSVPFSMGAPFIYWQSGDDIRLPMPTQFALIDSERFIVMMGMGRSDSTGREIFDGDTLTLTGEGSAEMEVICKYGTVERELRNFAGDINNCEITGFHFLVGTVYPTFPIAKNYLGVSDLSIMTITGNIYENK